jgi:hypothetical protein
MGRRYTAVINAVAVSAAQDLFALKTSANVPLILHECRIGQTTDKGNAAEEILRVRILRGTTTLGSGGTTPTPQPADPGDAAAVCTTHVNDTTPSSAGTQVTLLEDTFNDRAGWLYVPVPEDRFLCPVGTIISINLPTAPANSITVSATLIFEEFGK